MDIMYKLFFTIFIHLNMHAYILLYIECDKSNSQISKHAYDTHLKYKSLPYVKIS